MFNYDYYLFDWDGNLAKTLEVWLNAYKKVFKKYGKVFKKYGKDLDDRTIATEAFGNWHAASDQGIDDVEGFSDQLIAEVNSEIKKVDLYEGAKDLLLKLKSENKNVVLLSSSLKELIMPALKLHEIENVFDFILDGNDVEKHKPDPEGLNKAIQKLKANKNKTIMVGDSKSDLGAANSAGIDSILFYPKSHELFYEKEMLLSFDPTFVIEKFSDFR